jgi:hypothetical protein
VNENQVGKCEEGGIPFWKDAVEKDIPAVVPYCVKFGIDDIRVC